MVMMMVGDGGDGGGHGDDDGLRIEGASRVWSRREVSRDLGLEVWRAQMRARSRST